MLTPTINNNQTFKEICEKFDASVLQQLYKKITDDEGKISDKSVFPVALVQSVFDAITGIRLDDILSHYNYLYVRYKGSDSTTRLSVPIAHRRKTLILSYTDYEGNIRVEQYIGNTVNDEDWQHEDNWKTPFTEGNFIVSITNEQMTEYLQNYFKDVDINNNISEAIQNILNDYIQEGNVTNDLTEIVNNYLNDNLGNYIDEKKVREIIEEYLDNLNIDDDIKDKVDKAVQQYFEDNKEYINNAINDFLEQVLNPEDIEQMVRDAITNNLGDILINFFKTDEGKEIIREAIEPQLEELIGEYFEAFKKYMEDNERVIANALARHEQAITDLQNS